MPKAVNIPKEDLYRLYIEEEKTQKEIGEIYHCNPATVGQYLVKYGIPKRMNRPWMIERNRIEKKKYNEYDLSHEYGIGYASNTNNPFFFDLEDYEKIKDICWMESSEGYLIGRDPNGKTARMHNVVMGDKHIDHINHNKSDNRKHNLRKSTDQLNAMNRSLPINNRSGCKGVCWKTREGKWRSYITFHKKHMELGLYDKLEDAIKARLDAENELFGEWAYYASMNKGGIDGERIME